MNILQIIVFSAIYVMFAHFIADWVFQTREMGKNKSSSIMWLSIHVLIYTTTLYLICWIPFHEYGMGLLNWVLLNGVIHWCVDFVTSRLTSYYFSKNMEKHFFTTIGFDQFLHTTSLFGTVLLFQ